jgi:hypothetical protein
MHVNLGPAYSQKRVKKYGIYVPDPHSRYV